METNVFNLDADTFAHLRRVGVTRRQIQVIEACMNSELGYVGASTVLNIVPRTVKWNMIKVAKTLGVKTHTEVAWYIAKYLLLNKSVVQPVKAMDSSLPIGGK